MTQSISSSLPTIAIIGAGFSGVMVAVHLLQHAKVPLAIKLIERRPEAGRGVAYSTSVEAHLLNVPAGKMSAFPDRPEHFLNWLQSSQQTKIVGLDPVNASTFVPRMIYGDYIQAVLSEAVAQAPSHIHLERKTAEAIAIEALANKVRIHLNTGEYVQADKVVLALGNFSAQMPAPIATMTSAYVRDAWARDAIDQLNRDESVLLIGTGLTMVDLVVALRQKGHRGKIYAVSRHGLLPQRHQSGVAYPQFIDLEHAPQTLRGLVRRVRQEIQTATARGEDWRAVIDALRPLTQSLWQNLSATDQKRFLRHVKSYWEVYRHRIAPEIAVVLDGLAEAEQLVYYAGRIQRCQPVEGAIEVTVRQRGSHTAITIPVQRIVNCTGANCNYRQMNHPLISSLRDQRLIRCHPLSIGLDTAENGALIDAEGKVSDRFYTLGTPRKGMLWETTAVPELRVQAQNLAEALLQLLPRPVSHPFTLSSLLSSQQSTHFSTNPLIFRQLFDQESCTYTYLIGNTHLRIAAIIDPVLEQIDRDLRVLHELGLTLYYCLETHIHADHITSSHQLRNLTGCQVIVPDAANVAGADHAIKNGEILYLGNVRVEAIATPGHTASHMAYLINQTHLLTGDTLLIRGCGRTDLQGGDAGALYDVVTQTLFSLPDDTLVCPGHDYQGRTVSTIGEEKQWNPRFAMRDRSQFIELMTNLKLPYPKKMNEAVPANEHCGSIPEKVSSSEFSPLVTIPDPSFFAGMYI